MGRRRGRTGWLAGAVALALLALAVALWPPAQTARGKVGALAATPADPQRAQAEAMALADARVRVDLNNHRAEVMADLLVGQQLTADSLACALSPCQLVEIYDFDADATVTAVVDTTAGQVRDVLLQPGVRPNPNQRLLDLARGLAIRSPEFIREVGRVPAPDELTPMISGVPGTACDHGHLCLAATLPHGRSLVWAVVDVTAEKLAAVLRTPIPAQSPAAATAGPALNAGCPAGGSLTRGGWSVHYETTSTDGFRVYAASYLGVPVLTSAKIVEWHVDYGTTGFVDATGCASYIFPFGDTQVSDLMSGPDVIGFELVQDFRQSAWGAICNYRYEQHDQFFNDGRFRIVGEAFGQGCATTGIYRPVMRIDLGLAGAGGNSFQTWEGAAWQPQPVEGWWAQGTPYTPQGYRWRLSDKGGQAYFVEPGQGQFGDGGKGDFAFLYATQHHAAEGDTDLGSLGTCCNGDYQQGPDQYLNGQSIAGQDIVLWYVAQMQTDADPGNYYCWTVSTSETYPCPAGPMFVPMPLAADFVDNAPQAPAASVAFTSTSGGLGQLAYDWDFGDGAGSSSAANPVHSYTAAGIYTVTLTLTDTGGTQSATHAVAIGVAPQASFDAALSTTISNTVLLTNTTTGTPPLSFQWAFGDGATSTATAPSHTYADPGWYTVMLTATNFITSSTGSRLVAVPPLHIYWPIVMR